MAHSHTELILCERCNQPYKHTKSSSSLRMTYCSINCEQADLGFTMEALERNDIHPDLLLRRSELKGSIIA